MTRTGRSLFVAEAFPRSLWRGAAYLPALGCAALANPFRTRRHRLAKVLFTYLFPLIWLLGAWDWIASVHRIHPPDALLALAGSLAPHYHFTHTAVPYPPWGRALVVTGTPVQ